jgi:ABC-type multidrug transport system ATPase subunit
LNRRIPDHDGTVTTENLALPVGSGAGLAVPAAVLQANGVSKRFPGVLALDGIDFHLVAGEVHVLFGENGAGKSTLIQIFAGVQRPTEGNISFRGKRIEGFTTPARLASAPSSRSSHWSQASASRKTSF